MKKTLLIASLLLSVCLRSQVVFCPKGAEWNYNFNLAFSEMVSNEKIQYVRDSIMGSDTVKVLKLIRFYKVCNLLSTELVLIKQSGDLVLFRCKETQHKWETLYNYGAAVGEIWQTKILLGNNTMNTYTVQVDSINFITENSFQLKQLSVSYIWLDLPGNETFTYTQNYKITERFGCDAFLFNYRNGLESTCDGDYFDKFLCYRDSSFGLKQFTSYPCDYEVTVGAEELGIKNEELKIAPNPAITEINISFNKTGERNITVTDLLGKQVLTKQTTEKNIILNTEQLNNGIYFLKVSDAHRQSVHKIVVEK